MYSVKFFCLFFHQNDLFLSFSTFILKFRLLSKILTFILNFKILTLIDKKNIFLRFSPFFHLHSDLFQKFDFYFEILTLILRFPPFFPPKFWHKYQNLIIILFLFAGGPDWRAVLQKWEGVGQNPDVGLRERAEKKRTFSL